MATDSGSLASPFGALAPNVRRRAWMGHLRTAAFLAPATLLAALFLYSPLAFIVHMSFTAANSFLTPSGPIYTFDNYVLMVQRYLPNLFVTIQLAGLAMLVDLVFGVPFAYILVRRVRY